MQELGGIHFSPAEPEDLPTVWEAFRAAAESQAVASACESAEAAPDLPPAIFPHLLATSEGTFLVARARGGIVGFVAAVPRGEVWYLGRLWVDPEWRGRGIGTRLYRQARRATRGAGARVRAALAGDNGGGLVVALRDGLLARHPIFRLEGSAEAADALWEAYRSPPAARLVAYDRGARFSQRSPLAILDREARGATRPQDHAFWLADPHRRGFLVWLGRRAVAYFYVDTHGEVGPVAAAGTESLLWALRFAAREAARSAGRVGVRLPAVGRPALEALIGAGFRLQGGQLLLATASFGKPENYVPVDDVLF